MENGEYSAYEKTALVVWHLAHGEGMRTADVESLTGLTRQGAYKLMTHLCRVLPIHCDRGVWEVAFSEILT